MANLTHVRLAATAKRLIEKHGRSVSFVRVSGTQTEATEPWRGAAATGETTTTAIAAVFDDMTFDTAGTMVHRKNVRTVLVAQDSLGASVDLSLYDFLVDRGQRQKVTRRLGIQPGDVVIVWMLEAQH